MVRDKRLAVALRKHAWNVDFRVSHNQMIFGCQVCNEPPNKNPRQNSVYTNFRQLDKVQSHRC